MSNQTRRYTKKRRAELEEQTRLRITESAVALHGSLGPARTSMSAVAERAGVQRSTLYRHFPDEGALFDACSAHWLAANPRPDFAAWALVRDPQERLEVALREMYGYYRRTEPMLSRLMRDIAHPLVAPRMAGMVDYLAAARDILLHGRNARGARRTRVSAAIGHALGFSTWRSLTGDQQLDDAQAIRLMARLVETA